MGIAELAMQLQRSAKNENKPKKQNQRAN